MPAALKEPCGQSVSAAAKSGVVELTVPLARNLCSSGISVDMIAPETFDIPMLRLAFSEEIARRARILVECACIDVETVRFDGGLRLSHLNTSDNHRNSCRIALECY